MTPKEKLKLIFNETGLRYDSLKDVDWDEVLNKQLLSDRFITLFRSNVLDFYSSVDRDLY